MKQSKRTGKFRSQFEAMVALNLQKRGIEFEYEKDRISYTSYYIPDIRLPNGIYIELKGFFDASDRSKHIKVKREHPEIDIRFCFMNAKNKLSKGSKTTYGSWCDRHGFKWTEGKIPQEWLEE